MIRALSLVATAALAFAAPVVAQQAPAANSGPPIILPISPKSPAEAELEVKTEAFKIRIAPLQAELHAAVRASGGDTAKGMAAVDAVLARYRPDIESYAVELDAYFDGLIGEAPDDATRQRIAADKAKAGATLRGIPDQIRAGAPQAIASMGGASQ
ncbi:MAG: hypothetical protein P0Y52_14940 [Candidatus Brevundimonas phytovorans]|nr:hypothetical protein [Brevundimonas sp.]WEK57816.1 MAG: hypothetical protein P0Y52_14940 [Brevundimonas sp.]